MRVVGIGKYQREPGDGATVVVDTKAESKMSAKDAFSSGDALVHARWKTEGSDDFGEEETNDSSCQVEDEAAAENIEPLNRL